MNLQPRTIKRILTPLTGLFLLLAATLVAAEQLVENKDYVVHYSAFNSTHLTPEVADRYGLMRSRQRGVINIAVQRKQPGGTPKAVMAQLEGFTGQRGGSEIPLQFQVVEEGDAIYYLAEFRIHDGDQLDFDIKVKPTPEVPQLKVSFSQEFYTD
ncbi:MAG: DUF4426 domain-containing protein [Pseudomonadota bacterium]|nr:DUF4426 domain-containing protein [Pseudomonadota bacterium]